MKKVILILSLFAFLSCTKEKTDKGFGKAPITKDAPSSPGGDPDQPK